MHDAHGCALIEVAPGEKRLDHAVVYRSYCNDCFPYDSMKPHCVDSLLPPGYFTYAPHRSLSNCSSCYSQVVMWKHQEANVTFGSGVSLPLVNVSAQSAGNTSTKLCRDLMANGRVCGSNVGWATAREVDTRKW